jgi:hypothetical protein
MNHLLRAGLLFWILLFGSMDQLQSQSTHGKSMEDLLPSDTLKSQNADHHPWWVNLGAGPALVGTTFAMNGGMVYCYQFDRSCVSARILGVTNNNPTVQTIDQSSTIYKMAEYGILYGPIWQTEYGYISVGAGAGFVRAAYETPFDISTNTSISFPMEVQWFWRFTAYAGLGVYTYASLNFEKSFYGVMLCAQLGAW